MEGALEADDLDPLRLAVRPVILAGGLQRALDRLGARVAEEHLVDAGGFAEPRGQRLLARDAEDVGDVPELLALVLQRLHQLRMRVAEAGGGDAGQAVEVGLALGRVEPRASAAFERQRGAVVDAHDVVVRCGRLAPSAIAASKSEKSPHGVYGDTAGARGIGPKAGVVK